jgi:hypothetical protein
LVAAAKDGGPEAKADGGGITAAAEGCCSAGFATSTTIGDLKHGAHQYNIS